MITYYDAQKRLLTKFDYPAPESMTTTEEVQTLDNVKSAINSAIKHIYKRKMPWLRPKQTVLALKDSYSTGTLTATDGSRTLTGAGTTWTREMVGQMIIITDDTDGDVVYEIEAFTSATSMTLTTPYIHTGGAGLAYEVFYNKFLLPPDFKTFDVVQWVDTVNQYQSDEVLLQSSVAVSTSPLQANLIGLSESSYYETGTVTVANGATAVVGVTGVWDSTMVGRYIQIGNYSRLYKITAVADANNLTIDKGFGGTAVSAGKYKIDPPGRMQIRFHGAPDTAMILPYSYWPWPPKLTDDNDTVPIPEGADRAFDLTVDWRWYYEEDRPEQAAAKGYADEALDELAGTKTDERQKSMPPRRRS